jgi:flagellar biosynthesis/type III secretory pathway protein FliH
MRRGLSYFGAAMSGIIKSANHAGLSAVRHLGEPLAAASVIPIGKHDEERETLLRRISKLEEDLRRRELEAEELATYAERAREEGTEQGYESGLIAAQDRQSERLDLLERSLQKAQADLSDSLGSLSRLSALLAQDCVDIVLGNAGDRAEFITRIAQAQIAKLDRAMLCDVNLSRLDFPDDQSIGSLVQRLGGPHIHCVARDDLPSGACIMTLKLGRISVGIDQQWPALRTVLDQLALPGDAE